MVHLREWVSKIQLLPVPVVPVYVIAPHMIGLELDLSSLHYDLKQFKTEITS